MDNRVESITRGTLNPLVRQASADSDAQVVDWSIEPIQGGSGGMVGGTELFRFSGETATGSPWSLVLKILHERPDESEDSPYYWKREYEVYRSRMLNELPDTGLTPPSVYGLAEFPGEIWIWMEELRDERSFWTLDDYHAVSRRLGRFNGAYVTGEPIPDETWLNTNWHCRIIPPLADTFARLDEYLETPLVQRALPLSEKETILAIWAQAPQLCEVLLRLPQTLCHIDAFRGNVFHDGDSAVLIDWALAGTGALGEDLTALVALSLYQPETPPSQAQTLDEAVFSGYMQGLRDAGWRGDERFVRLGYVCAMTLRGLAGVKQDIELLLDENTVAKLGDGPHQRSIEEIADLWAEIRRFRLLDMAEEARRLLAAERQAER